MTTPPFTTRIETASFAELQADAALCRKVLSTGYVNGYPLDSETEAEWEMWLSDFCAEIETRAEAAEPLPLSNAA